MRFFFLFSWLHLIILPELHWSFSLLLPFINIGSILRPMCSFKLRKLTSGYVFEEKLEENAGVVWAKI